MGKTVENPPADKHYKACISFKYNSEACLVPLKAVWCPECRWSQAAPTSGCHSCDSVLLIFSFFKTKRWIRSSGALLSAELCWVRPHGSFSCLLFVTVAKVKRALGGNVTHFIIALHLNALRLVVNMAKGGSETHVSLLRVISKQTLAMKRYHESQQRAFRVPPRSSGKDRGHWPSGDPPGCAGFGRVLPEKLWRR